MKLFLQIEVTNGQQGGHGTLFLNYASSLADNIMGTDLDLKSEPMIADLVLRLIGQSKKIFLFIHANDSNLPLGVAQKIMNYLITEEQKIFQVVLCGDHRSTEQSLQFLNTRFTKETDATKIKELIFKFSQEAL